MAENIDRERLKEVFRRNVVSADVFNDIIDGQPTADVIEIPKNAANGDMIIALYPQLKYTILSGRVITTIGIVASFDLDWWNSPYKADKEKK